jgi:putative flippase GtrA
MSPLQYLFEHVQHLTRFAIIGLVCFIVGIGILTGLHELAGVHYLVAYGASFVVTSTLGYLLNGRFTFGNAGATGPGVVRYMSVNVVLILVNGAALRFLVEYFHMWYLSATFLLAAINTPVSYLAHRLVSYQLSLRQTPAGAGN